ncbi:hypothetical protein [Pontibacter cellulosilyticus]|uniref:Uncharacterized protein n=1 Tax=Pontibacter cellulosilyticus TaxID=1720253 RepID=A0A923SJM5_9BACT|nr:hypothetical protein [Pontibacter cellulosilyticus]MBC5993983.1 hypothetical protein [Pontibacter cellulosilyticus]
MQVILTRPCVSEVDQLAQQSNFLEEDIAALEAFCHQTGYTSSSQPKSSSESKKK